MRVRGAGILPLSVPESCGVAIDSVCAFAILSCRFLAVHADELELESVSRSSVRCRRCFRALLGSFLPFRNDLHRSEVSHLTSEFDFVSVDLASVFDADVLIVELEWLDE